jgi:RNA polymerase sigma-70 factor (ECF subfamily)
MTTEASRSGAAEDRLVRRAVRGDRQAFAELVRREERYMYALAMGRLGDEHLARDAVQDALLSAWEKVRDLREPRAFRSWLGRVVINAAISAGRKRRSGEHVALEEGMDAAHPAGPGDAAEAQERRRRLAGAVAALEEDRQILLAMYYSEGLSYAEIAGRLGITVGAVRGRLFQAREKLRAMLEEEAS